ncbi:MAG: MOSC N-terminal beta barrel domain-containing protein [Saprospiraceae bacterium]|nr:MOSC N-terminal beta barrel domain-containing protein [Saprospiraceae bacterium]
MQAYKTDEIYIYPIKSIGPIKQDQIKINGSGLIYDRYWMLIHPDGSAITQREFPSLNLIHITDDLTHFILNVEGHSVPAIRFQKQADAMSLKEVSLWNKQFIAYETQSELSKWFSHYLGTEILLVTNPSRIKELVYNDKIFNLPLNFQDGYPVHLINYSSINDLSNRCGVDLSPMRFRANIYLDLGTPYIEDEIDKIKINDIIFQFIKPCERCIMINLEPFTDCFQKEPLKSLSTYRKENNVVKFGIYLKVLASN